MPVILNKIDPVIINNVQQQTSEEVVHTSKEVRISKDRGQKKDGSSSREYSKHKLQKFNDVLHTMEVDMDFIMDGDTIFALDKEGRILKTYTEDEIIELFGKMEDMIGVLIDIKK